MIGPTYLEGAAAGDALRVCIDSVKLDRNDGQTGLASGHGFLSSDALAPGATVPRHLYRWAIDVGAGVAKLANPLGTQPIEVPLAPFIGCIGVCPPFAQHVSTLYAGAHGGNMDLPSLRAGTTVWFPVFAPGALLFVGDLHAAQGHGEFIGGAIETSGVVQLSIDVARDVTIDAPRFRRSDGHIGAVASDGDLRSAIQLALRRLLDWISIDLGLHRFDAYNLLSQTVSIELGNLTTSPYTVAAIVDSRVLPKPARERLERYGE